MNTNILEEFDSLDNDFLSTVAGGGVFNTIYMGPPPVSGGPNGWEYFRKLIAPLEMRSFFAI
ncbi:MULTISPECIES: hypothetical protein [Streptococcus]|uniref:hypothetical protein n=1 Tax=Streptococcus TaxID=1301 RepID=UPI001E44BD60|nr:hypothetical protein [Streptococcus sp. XMC]MCE3592677.1 hypothetical protein [Streptococcus sp. XMC]